ncbi:MAG: glutamine--fructose-6-phosphate transaminase (isomerizing) [Desulfurococcaceae archaeon]|nr:glutamine--fructose-6-phosphate transaminase (isomerizing) [Desulfurococcaceae archaeon]
MGGFAYLLSTAGASVAPLLLEVLGRMEFRGRDTSGVAWIEGGELRVVKDSVPIGELYARYGLKDLRTPRLLGHTRYSTHGKADPRNAHPHVDCRRRLAVVGDGALRNYEELLMDVLRRGHRVESKSDFEVVAHVIEELLDRYGSPVKGFLEAIPKLKGLISLAVMFTDGTVVAYTTHQPIYVGLGESLVAVANALVGLYGVADSYYEVLGGEVAVLSPEGRAFFVDVEGRTVVKSPQYLRVSGDLVPKGGYPHHMLREIYEVPYSILRTASAVQLKYLEMASRIILQSRRTIVIANGTSLHAGMVFSYYLAELAGITPLVVSSSEFPLYYVDNVGVGDVVVAISQSGETSEVLRSVYEARLRGATVVGLTNNINSRLTRFSNIYLPIAAGPELAVPATKTFTSTLALLYILAKHVGVAAGRVGKAELGGLWEKLEELSRTILSNLNSLSAQTREAAEYIHRCTSGYVVSRGITYPLALEGALKIKESSYLHAEGVEGGELRHGPISILDRSVFTIFIEPLEGSAAADMLNLVAESVSYGSPVVLLSHSLEGLDLPVKAVRVPKVSRHLMPIALAVPLQLLAYWLAVLRGVDVDKPRRLVKVVAGRL